VKVVDWLTKAHDPGARKLTFPLLLGALDSTWVLLASVVVAGIVNGHSISEYFSAAFLFAFVVVIVPISVLVLAICVVSRRGSRTRLPRWFYLACCSGLWALIGWLLGEHMLIPSLIGFLAGLTGMATFLERAGRP